MATVYRTLLEKGYFPKELPPSFHTDLFAKYATTKNGRAVLKAYTPPDRCTGSTAYQLALSGGHERMLALPHPYSFARLAEIVARDMGRLLRKSASRCSKSRPVYHADAARAIQPATRYANVAKHRALARGNARYLVRADVSQFYPSLYTHAVGWAIDPKLRQRQNWTNKKLLGKRVDQALMDWQRKVSQGVPVGNDLSFLLAEVVLAQVDRALKLDAGRAFRWFDDYEIACASREEAEKQLAALRTALHQFNLRINPNKTRIIALPEAVIDPWQARLSEAAREFAPTTGKQNLLGFFDEAFRLRSVYPDAAILSYALGLLFRIERPGASLTRLAQVAISQALLAEPGVAQKAFALLTYWNINGMALDEALLTSTIESIVRQQRNSGATSDVSWALFTCIQLRLKLSRSASRGLAETDDCCAALQSLHMKHEGLLPSSFRSHLADYCAANFDPDGDCWILAYEMFRRGFRSPSPASITTHHLMGDLLAKDVSFYGRTVPAYASVVHPGGAPEWVVRRWLSATGPKATPSTEIDSASLGAPVAATLAEDVKKLGIAGLVTSEIISRLLGQLDKTVIPGDGDGTGASPYD